MNWTEEQRQAIFLKGKNVLVTAAAGAGKTSVLVERVVQHLLDPQSPTGLENLLVVTFTDSAAQEMRQRIAGVLEEQLARRPEDPFLRRQLLLLPRAPISTLHSFCLRLVKRYFYRLGLDPSFRVMSEGEADLLQVEVMENLLEERFAQADPSDPFFHLVEASGPRSEEKITDLVLKVWSFGKSLPWPQVWWDQALEGHTWPPGGLKSFSWFKDLWHQVKLGLEEAEFYLNQALQLAAQPGGPGSYLPLLEEEGKRLRHIRDLWEKSPSEGILAALNNFSFDRLPPAGQGVIEEVKKEVQDLRDQAKALIKEIGKTLCREEELIKKELQGAAFLGQACIDLVKRFEADYEREKRRRALVDFSDLEHLAFRLLQAEEAPPGELRPSPLAQEMRDRFQEVLVDEYQDINPLQDALLHLLSRQGEDSPNLFLVGDVKQSIYRFRLACPQLFLEKRKNCSHLQGCCVPLRDNFRSRPGIIHGVNFLFQQLFSPCLGGIEYGEEEALKPSASYPPHPAAPSPEVEFYLLESEGGEEDFTPIEREARFIARRIKKMVESEEFHVWDKGLGTYRPVEYRDVALLLRAPQDRAAVVVEKLQQEGVPVYAQLSRGYFSSVEVETVLSLLRLVDNPRQDIPLAAVLRSPIVGLTPEELARLRFNAPEGDFYTAVVKASHKDDPLGGKLRKFLHSLERWRTLARRCSLVDLIWEIYRETGYVEMVGGWPGGAQRQANLQLLLERAQQFQGFVQHSLFRFLRFIDRLKERQGDLGLAPTLGEKENVVQVMSIHRAKGLEFPVVVLSDLGRRFNLRDQREDFLLHGELGLAPLYVDPEMGVKYPTLPYLALAHRLKLESLSEELRILYVALTRAREKLLLVGCDRDPDRLIKRCSLALLQEERELPLSLLIKAQSPLEWLVMALLRHPQAQALRDRAGLKGWVFPEENSCFRICLIRGSEEAAHSGGGDLSPVPEPEEKRQEWRKRIEARLTWKYPYKSCTSLPVKWAVSELKRRFDYIRGEGTADLPRTQGVFHRRPLFLQKIRALTPAERGVALHLLLQHVDLRAPVDREALIQLRRKLVEEEFLTPEAAEQLDLEVVEAFFLSPLGKRLLAQPHRVKREVPFSLWVPAREFYPGMAPEGEMVIVQGIIDCLVEEEGGLLLIDFKTGRIPPSLEEYREQVKWYVRAAQSIWERPVKEAYLYFLDQGEAVPL